MKARKLRDDLKEALINVCPLLTHLDKGEISQFLRLNIVTVHRYMKGDWELNMIQADEVLNKANEIVERNEKAQKQQLKLLAA